MSTDLRFDQIRLPPACEKLRDEVRAFVAEEVAAGTFAPDRPGHGDTHDRAFSKRVGAKGWIGMTWPKKYGGHERSFLERHVVTEEFRVVNAPVRLHFVADRQSGPILLKYAPEHIKQDILPRICRGELCFVIGMSEPNSGSDLFAAKTKATKVDGGWKIKGSKIWTSNAHIADYMLGLFRTSPPTKENRRHGLTQFLVDMKTPGIAVNPIIQMTGQHDFNEVLFDDAFIPDDHALGEINGAWKQASRAGQKRDPDREAAVRRPDERERPPSITPDAQVAFEFRRHRLTAATPRGNTSAPMTGPRTHRAYNHRWWRASTAERVVRA